MKKFLGLLLLLGSLAAPASAAVTLTFDADTQGFSTVGWNAANGSTSWSANHGGSLAITATVGGWSNPLTVFDMNSSLVQTEFQNALANGGTLSFDYIIDRADVIGYNPTNPPEWFELVAYANSDEGAGGGWDQNVIGGAAGFYNGIPEGLSTRRVSINIAAGAPAANNDTLNYGMASAWKEFMIGINSEGGTYTGATFYIDNLTVVSAIPEPSSFALLGGCGAFAIRWYRRRRTATLA